MRNLTDRIHEHTVKFNPRFTSSYCKAELDNAPSYVDNIFICANQAFPEGMSYEGFNRCSPESTYYLFIDKTKTNDRRYQSDLSRTDVFMCQFNFSFKGVKLKPTYLYLPFLDNHGIMHIRDKAFYIKPVVADPLISISEDGLFIPLNQTKMTTRPLFHYVIVNDTFKQVKIFETTIHHSLSVVHKNENKLSRQRISTNMHYLLCYGGLTKAFEKHFSCDIKFGTEETINTKNYPKSEWTIIRGAEDPRFIQMDNTPNYNEQGVLQWKDHGVRLAISNKQATPEVKSAAAAVLYILDLLPEIDDIAYVEDPAWWKLKLGQIILGIDEDHRSLMKKMGSHFTAIESYIDSIAINLLRADNIYIEDMCEYLAWGIREYDRYVNGSKEPISSMYGKLLMVNRYIFQPIRVATFNAIYALRQKSADRLTPKVIEQALNSQLQPSLITKINNNFPNVVPILSASESRLLKTGIEIMPQDAMRPTKQEKQPAMLYNPKWKFDVSRIDAGGFASMSKSEPVGKDTACTNIEISLNGVIGPQKQFIDLLNKTRKFIAVDGE